MGNSQSLQFEIPFTHTLKLFQMMERESKQDPIPAGQAAKRPTWVKQRGIEHHCTQQTAHQYRRWELSYHHTTSKKHSVTFQSSTLKSVPHLSHLPARPDQLVYVKALLHARSFNWFTQVSEQGIITSWKIMLGRVGQPASMLWDLKVENKGRSGFIPHFNCKLSTAWCSETLH